MYRAIKNFIRIIVYRIAMALNKVSGGRISPNMVTLVGVLAHLPISWLITKGYFCYAGIGVIIFGLFDTLDGELARLQKRDSPFGMFLDSVTDRIKEILIYVGFGFFIANSGIIQTRLTANLYFYEVIPWIITALGLSLLVSYLNAWGEVALAKANVSSPKINSTLRGGFASYEIRIALLALGLILNEVWLCLITITFLCFITVIDRFLRVIKHIK